LVPTRNGSAYVGNATGREIDALRNTIKHCNKGWIARDRSRPSWRRNAPIVD
jgi:hypothetical protein